MNRRLRQRPPKHKLADRSGSEMWPIGCADGIENPHAVQRRIAHAPAAPQIAVDIDAEPVRRAGTGVDEHPVVGQFRPAHDIERPDQPVRLGA